MIVVLGITPSHNNTNTTCNVNIVPVHRVSSHIGFNGVKRDAPTYIRSRTERH